ncbi:MAG: ABC transporter permease, partial [Clostridia bacterium]
MLIVTLLEALELGLIYSILALGVFLSFRTLNTPDLTVDGSIVTGAAISAVVC